MGVTFANPQERLSTTDGYRIVARAEHRPRIHLLRPFGACGVPASSIAVEGSRELLSETLEQLGYRRGGVACRLCFPHTELDDVLEPEESFAEESD